MKKLQQNLSLTQSSPILKWAGGKRQLLTALNENYPEELKCGKVETYVEPFLGGAAVYFDIANKYHFQQAFLFDINPELILLYNTLKYNVDELIEEVAILEKIYLALGTVNLRAKYFYTVRELYNAKIQSHNAISAQKLNIKRAAKTIFLNRTCYNGLFRVNKKGLFNVPHGKYKNLKILSEENLKSASSALQRASIKQGDFSMCSKVVQGKTFIYYDPPYRPIKKTSHFTSYAKEVFDDNEQIRLANLIKKLDTKNVLQLLSNSDPTNYCHDPFFDELYADFNILRVDAKRAINSNANKRGKLREILIRNY